MTTVDITLSNGQQQNKPHDFLIKDLFELYLLKLHVIKQLLIASDNDELLVQTENEING